MKSEEKMKTKEEIEDWHKNHCFLVLDYEEIKNINFEEKEITIKFDIDSCIHCIMQLEKIKKESI